MPTLYLPSIATQLDGIYIIKEAQYKSTSKTFKKINRLYLDLASAVLIYIGLKGQLKIL